MPTGYNNRQGGRSSFADEGGGPVQTSTGASGESRGAQSVGGENIGGVVGGGFTEPGNVAGQLGSYFQKFMEPAVQRKQQEQFFKAYTEAQSGRALEEMTDNDSPLTKIFGPSGFAQGAQFYAAQANINKWGQDNLADIDNLKKMAPEELSKHMASSSQAMMTGDPYADQQIQAGLLEAQGPVIQTVAKARYKWQQDEMVTSMSNASNTSAAILQDVATTNARLGDKGDGEAVQMQAQRFVGGLAKPEGMSDENYQTFLYDFMRRNMADKNFYAVEIMMAQGVDDVLDDKQQEKLWAAYDRYGGKALDRAAADPEIMNEILKIDLAVATEQMSVADVGVAMGALNVKMRNLTGIQRDFFSPEDIRNAGGDVIQAIIGRQRREESRAWQIEDREATIGAAREEREAEANEEIANSQASWATGQIKAAIAGGISASNFETIAMEEYSNGNLGNIANAFKQSGWASTGVQSQVQAIARAGLGEKYTKSTEKAYEIWQQFRDVNPALAHEYFGEYSMPFTNFDRMVKGGAGTEASFRDAFAGPGQYARERIPADRRKEFDTELTTILASTDFNFWSIGDAFSPSKWGNTQLTKTSRQALGFAIGGEFAVLAQNSDRPTPELAKQAYTTALTNGRWEQYGEIGWANTRPGPTIGSVIGLKGKEAAGVVNALIKNKLGTIGITDMEGVRVIRTGNNLTVQSLVDGVTKHTIIPESLLKLTAQKFIERKRSGVKDEGGPARYSAAKREASRQSARRIPGESTWERVSRINTETAAWARANPPGSFTINE